MKTAFKWFLGGSLALTLILSILSFTQNHNKHFSPNPSVSIPAEVHIFDTTIILSRYDMRERFDREMHSFVYSHARTLGTIKRANNYFPIIEPILAKNGIPKDFKYLALVESNFIIRSSSSVGACGLWQLMPATAKELGLEVNEKVDERYHIEKSTEAACKYFIKSYKKFGNWFTVAASYNAGIGSLKRRVNQQLTSNPFDLVLPNETSRYLFRIIAAKELLKNPQKYGFIIKKEDLYHQIGFTEVEVDSTVANWAKFADFHKISYLQLKDFNVWLRDTDLPNKTKNTYKIKIPCKDELNFNLSRVFIYQKNWIKE